MIQSSPGNGVSPRSNDADVPDANYAINNNSARVVETDLIASVHGEPSAPSEKGETESIIISGSMPPSKILTQLSRHGCDDVTNQLNLRKISNRAVSIGGSGEVYRGALLDNRRVGIKCLRLLIGNDEEGEKQIKRAACELYIWSKCKHPNIQELIGVALYGDRVAMVSPWMKKGNLSWYISRNPKADRYSLCVQIAAAVAYLRENGVAHGDIKGENFLVSEDHIPKLTDFGSSNISKCSIKFTSNASSTCISLRWAAPEIVRDETQSTFEGDVYALGMTILEIITGSVPWSGMNDFAVVHNIAQNLHPSRPETCMPTGDTFADILWGLMASCWAKDPQERPLAKKVRDELDIINKKREIARHGTEGVYTHQIPTDSRTPIESTPNNTQTSGQHQTPTLNSKKSLLEKFLRRPNRSSNSVVTDAHKPKLATPSSASLTCPPQIRQSPLSERATKSPTGVLSRARWRSGSVSTPRHAHGRQRSSSTLSIPAMHSEIPRSKSSSSLLDPVPGQGSQLASLHEQGAADDPHELFDSLRLESTGPVPEIAPTSATDNQSLGSRKVLIISISYQDEEAADRVFPAEHLKGVFDDIKQLESIFTERSYSVQRLLGDFNWEHVLTGVAQFLEGATSGDVRAIVFAMYGYIDERRGVALVPPELLQGSGGITYEKWGKNIRDHSQPGVVVFSIMANAFSDRMFKQEFDRHVWEEPALMKPVKGDEPIYLTFAASNEFAYAGGWTRDSQPIHIGDHFINALVGAIRFVDVAKSTWGDFFEVFDDYFWQTRYWVSLLQQEMTGNQDLNWRLDHPQTPHFSASGFVRLSDVF